MVTIASPVNGPRYVWDSITLDVSGSTVPSPQSDVLIGRDQPTPAYIDRLRDARVSRRRRRRQPVEDLKAQSSNSGGHTTSNNG